MTSIESEIKIGNNKALTSLTGLDNVSYIGGDLNILLNEALTNCEILSICNYLANPNGVVTIQDNAIGCNSPEEVQDSCEANAVAIDEQYIRDNLILYPNPANQELNISAEGFIIDEVIIYTLTGQQVYAVRPKSETIDISTLPPGMYIVEVMVEGRKVMRKLLIE